MEYLLVLPVRFPHPFFCLMIRTNLLILNQKHRIRYPNLLAFKLFSLDLGMLIRRCYFRCLPGEWRPELSDLRHGLERQTSHRWVEDCNWAGVYELDGFRYNIGYC